MTFELSKPANGSYVAAGERIVVTVTLKDKYGSPLVRNDFSTLALYMYGPQDPIKVVTAVKLLNASENRSVTPHHFIDLLTNNTTDLKINGSVLIYTLQAVTNELPGTYTVAVRATKKGSTTVNQMFLLNNIQLGTATVEQQTVNLSKCASCHLGADSGQVYMHHVDGSATNPYGSFVYDNGAIATCKSCHNNNGYASYVSPAGSTTRIADVIINRVHGVHMGEHLKNPINNTPGTGAFRNYTEVIFPNNAKNCTSCHTNDNWKTKPSRLACGTCHDNIWFGGVATMPAGYVAHPGDPWPSNDDSCVVCHKPEVDFVATGVTGNLTIPSITNAHKVVQPLNTVNISMTRPANGQFYVAGEKPVVTLVYRDDNGNPIDHTAIDTNYLTANLYVYGPRWQSKPVLTNTAINGNTKVRAAVTSTIAGPWTFVAGDTFKIAVSGGPVQTLTAPVGVQTAAQVAMWLQASLGANVTVTATAANQVTLQHLLFGDASKFEIYNSPVTTKMGWKPAGLPIIKDGVTVRYAEGTTMEPYVIQAAVGTPAVNLRLQAAPNYNDPNVVRAQGSITYQLYDVTGLTPGTYMVYSYNVPAGVTAGTGDGPVVTAAAKAAGRSREGLGLITFQVGTATPDKKVATNCTNCHGSNIFHLDTGAIHSAPFDTDYCKACHDYNLSGVGEGYARTGGTSTSGWAGYGTKPLVNRLHGVHFGAYKTRPEDIYAGNAYEFAGVIFPQDVRNCTKCHSADTTGTWKMEPSVLTCMACHDSAKARSHGELNTFDPTPLLPDSKDEIETCDVCHGASKEFSPDKVHNISNPYVPPYPRE
ncbi:MAG: hypothetical protein Q7J73_06655 [Dehalococcoidales bacterium]|nr:hypothetical protein [Dehalococcoidales bacterium]